MKIYEDKNQKLNLEELSEDTVVITLPKDTKFIYTNTFKIDKKHFKGKCKS